MTTIKKFRLNRIISTEFDLELESYINNILSKSQKITHSSLHSSLHSSQIIFTSKGPSSYPSSGSILDYPDLVWSEDKWSESRYELAKQRIELQGKSIGSYWMENYITKASKYWNKFYKRNQDHFYKDRHYLHVVFPELLSSPSTKGMLQASMKLLEIGCGVGNAILPLLEINPYLDITAIDFSSSAIEILQSNPIVITSQRIHAISCDIVNDQLPVPEESMDFVLCMFVLSAIHPNHHREIVQKIFRVLKPGGKLLFRDYGRYDEAQLRFGKGSKLDENFYVRQDGTCAYYFDKEDFASLVCDNMITTSTSTSSTSSPSSLPSSTSTISGNRYTVVVEENEYIQRQYANRQQKVARYRVWIHAKFRKQDREIYDTTRLSNPSTTLVETITSFN